MPRINVPGVMIKQASAEQFVVASVPVDPKCIVHHRFPRVGDVVDYNRNDCVRVGDGATTTFTLDSDGVPTIIGVLGTLGVRYGVYECTISFNGVSEVVPVSHLEDTAIEAAFTTGTRDAEGYTVFTPASTGRLLYVDTTLGNNTTQGPNGDDTDWYTGASPPAGGWEEPSSVNAFADIETAKADRRDGFADWILLKRGEVFVPTESINYSGISGVDAVDRQMVIAYGTGARPWINPAATFAVNLPVIRVTAEAYVGVSGIRIYPTFRDPDHGDFAGYANIAFSSGIQVYTGGTPVSTMKGYHFEDNEVLFCNGGIGFDGQGGATDAIVRRNIVANGYNIDNTSGFSMGDGSTSTDWGILIEDNILDHNGWYQQAINVTGTASSGSTTTLTDTGAFAGVDYATVRLLDDVGTGTTTITSNTDDVLTFDAAANVDFTSRTAYTIGGGQGAGQANVFNHNMYLRNLNSSIVRNNIVANGSSVSIKITSTKVGAEQHEMRDFIEYNNLSIYNELGLGGGGNTADSTLTRFQDMRVMDNVELNKGLTDPTTRGVGWGIVAADWNRGELGKNIVKDSGAISPDIDNVWGISIARICTDTTVVYNQIIDIGKSTGSATSAQGCLYINDDSANANLTGIKIFSNDFQQQNTDGLVVADWLSAESSSITMKNNRYHASRGDTDSYRIDAVQGTYAAYVTETGETGQTNAAIDYLDIGVGIANYQRERGGTATIDAFITEAKGQIKGSYDSTLEAQAVNAYTRTGLANRPDTGMAVAAETLGATDGTTQDIEFTAGIGVVKGLFAILCNDKLVGSPSGDNHAIGIGFGDGTTDVSTWAMADTETTPSQVNIRALRNDVLLNRTQGGSAWREYTVNSFTTDKAVLGIASTVQTYTFQGIFMAFAGDNVEVKVGSYDDMGTGTAEQKITTGHKTDLFFASTVHQNVYNNSDSPNEVEDLDCTHSFGFAINDTSLSQAGFAEDSIYLLSSPSEITSALYNDAILGKVSDGAVEDYSIAVTQFDTDGVNLQSSASASNSIVNWMSVSWKQRPKMKIVDVTIPTSGDLTIDTPGFKPRFGIMLTLCGVSSYNTATDASMSFGLTVFDANQIHTSALAFTDNETQDNQTGTGRHYDGSFGLMVKGGSYAEDVGASAYTFTNEGVTFTMDNWPASEALGRLLVIG